MSPRPRGPIDYGPSYYPKPSARESFRSTKEHLQTTSSMPGPAVTLVSLLHTSLNLASSQLAGWRSAGASV